MSAKINGALLVCIAATMWGFDGVVLTPHLFHLNVPFVVFILHLLPFIGMSFLFGKKEISNIQKLSKNDIFFFFMIALFGGALGTLSIVKALFLVNFKNLTIVTLLQKLQPIFAIILAKIVLKEKFKKQFLIWGLIALIAGYFLTFELNAPLMIEENLLSASFYSLLAAFSFGSATVFGKRVLNATGFRTALYLRYMFTTIITLIICLFTGSLGGFFTATKIEWAYFILIGLTTGSFAIYLYYIGLSSINAGISTVCELCFPLSTVLFDYVFNGNILSPIQIISAIIMLFSIIKISKLSNNKIES